MKCQSCTKREKRTRAQQFRVDIERLWLWDVLTDRQRNAAHKRLDKLQFKDNVFNEVPKR